VPLYFSAHGPWNRWLQAGSDAKEGAGIARMHEARTRVNADNLRENDRSLGEALPGHHSISTALELLHTAALCVERAAVVSASPGGRQ